MNEKAPLPLGLQWPEGRQFERIYSVPEDGAAYVRALNGYHDLIEQKSPESAELAAVEIVIDDFSSRRPEFIEENRDTTFEADFESIYADSPRHQAGFIGACFGYRDVLLMGGHEGEPIVDALEVLIKGFSERFKTFLEEGAPQPRWMGGKYFLDNRFPVLLKELGVEARHG